MALDAVEIQAHGCRVTEEMVIEPGGLEGSSIYILVCSLEYY
jgi:hypothetical protein